MVDVFEAVAEPEPIGAGVLLQPTGLSVLDKMGLRKEMIELGSVVHRLIGDTADGQSVLNMDYRCISQASHGLGVQRGALMGVLWRTLFESGANWHTGVRIDSLVQDITRVKLVSQNKAIGRFDLVVLANGTFSKLRKQMQVKQSEAVFPWGALWCLLPQPKRKPITELLQKYRGAKQMIGLMPVGRPIDPPPGHAGEVNVFWSMSPRALQEWQITPNLDVLKLEMISLMPEAAELIDGLVDIDQLKVARYADVRMERWHDGRVVAIGDCAHAMSPQLGQGANMALIDSLVLAHKLAEHADSEVPEALDSYTQARRAHLNFYQSASRWLTPLFQSDQQLGPWFRDRFFGIGGRLPWVKQQSMSSLSGMKSGWIAGRLKLPGVAVPKRRKKNDDWWIQ